MYSQKFSLTTGKSGNIFSKGLDQISGLSWLHMDKMIKPKTWLRQLLVFDVLPAYFCAHIHILGMNFRALQRAWMVGCRCLMTAVVIDHFPTPLSCWNPSELLKHSFFGQEGLLGFL